MGESALPRTERQNPAGSRSPRRGFALGGREKEGPSSRLGLGTHETSRGRTLDAPILSHGTNQARRGSRLAPRIAEDSNRRLSCNCPWRTVLGVSCCNNIVEHLEAGTDTHACATRSKGRSSLAPFAGQPGWEPKEVGKKDRCYSAINQHGSFRQ